MAKKRSKTPETRSESKVLAGGVAVLAGVGLWYFASGGTVDALVEDFLVTEVAQPVIPVDLDFPTYVEEGAHFAIPAVEEVVVEEVEIEEVIEEEVIDVETELN